jgi:hypothetical protein
LAVRCWLVALCRLLQHPPAHCHSNASPSDGLPPPFPAPCGAHVRADQALTLRSRPVHTSATPQDGRTAAASSRTSVRPQRGVRTASGPRATARAPTTPLADNEKAAIVAAGVWATLKIAYFAAAAARVMGTLARPWGHPMLRHGEADPVIGSS